MVSCGSGFTVANASCCPSLGTNGLCIPNQTPCQNRTTYVFWDQFHPTEAANRIIIINSYNGSNPAPTYPMDIKHLVWSWMMIQFKLWLCPWIIFLSCNCNLHWAYHKCQVTCSKSSVLFFYSRHIYNFTYILPSNWPNLTLLTTTWSLCTLDRKTYSNHFL